MKLKKNSGRPVGAVGGDGGARVRAAAIEKAT